MLTSQYGNNIDYNLQQQLILDFNEFMRQYRFMRMEKEINRINSLKIQYILFQLLRRHGYDCGIKDFPSMPKTLNCKLDHDRICSSIFQKFGWTFNKPSNQETKLREEHDKTMDWLDRSLSQITITQPVKHVSFSKTVTIIP